MPGGVCGPSVGAGFPRVPLPPKPPLLPLPPTPVPLVPLAFWFAPTPAKACPVQFGLSPCANPTELPRNPVNVTSQLTGGPELLSLDTLLLSLELLPEPLLAVAPPKAPAAFEAPSAEPLAAAALALPF